MLNDVQTVLINVTTTESNNGVILGNYGMRASALPPAGSPPADTLDYASLMWVVDAAITMWHQAGIPLEAINLLRELEFRIMDLPGAYLGHYSGNVIWIDSTAAGYGWFVDLTPWDDEEFDSAGRALSGGLADSKIDLLTVVLHELGHALGLGHSDDPDSLMFDLLEPSHRRRIRATDVDSWFASQG